MKRLGGVLMIVLGMLLVLVSLISIVSNVIPGVSAVASVGTPYLWGRLVGGVVVTVLFFLLGRAAFRAGRRRLDAPAAVDPENA